MNIERWVKTNRLTDEQLAIANELNERGIETFTDAVFSIGEPALAIISSSIAEPIAGLAGLGMAAFEDVNSGVKTIEQVKNALSYQPRTRGGKTGMEFVADTLQPVSDAFTAAEDYLGDNTLELTGSPLLAAGAATIPAAIAELNPLGKASKQATKMGIFAGKKAKTADLNKQAMAEELLNRGMDRDTIWKETGWFKDVDDHWKFEIDDSEFKLNPFAPKKGEFEVKTAGGDLYQHDQLQASYPEVLDNMTVSFEPEMGSQGSYRSIGESELLGRPQEHFIRVNDPGNIKSSGRIEQWNKKIEEWSKPDYPEEMAKKYDLTIEEAKAEIFEDIEILKDNIKAEALIPEGGVDFYKPTRSTVSHETQHAIQEREGFSKGGTTGELVRQKEGLASEIQWRNKQIAELTQQAKETPKYQEIESQLIKALDSGDESAINSLISEQNEFLNNFPHLSRHKSKVWELSDEKNKIKDPFKAYQRLAGEAEARNVQARLDMTPEERAATPPWKTLDVPEDELILKDVSGLAMSEGSPIQVKKGNNFLFDFDPDMLEKTEFEVKNIENYKGDAKKPITVTKDGGKFKILDGHHRAKIAKESGDNVRAVVIPVKDVKNMKKKGVHPADMRTEWISTEAHLNK